MTLNVPAKMDIMKPIFINAHVKLIILLIECNISCKACIDESIKCLSCESTYFRVLNNLNECICLDGYYDIGIEIC